MDNGGRMGKNGGRVTMRRRRRRRRCKRWSGRAVWKPEGRMGGRATRWMMDGAKSHGSVNGTREERGSDGKQPDGVWSARIRITESDAAFAVLSWTCG